MSDQTPQTASAVIDQPTTVATISTRKLSKDDIGTTVLLQAIQRTYADDGICSETWTDASNFTVLGLRPATVDGRWTSPDRDCGVATFYRSDIRVVRPAIVKAVKAPKVVKVGLDLCHDKTDTNPFGKVSLPLAIERMRAWATANYKRGGDVLVECWTDDDYSKVFMDAGQKIAGTMKTLRSVAAVHYEQQSEGRIAAQIEAKTAKADAAKAKSEAALVALTAKIEAAKQAAIVKAAEGAAAKAKLIAEAQARADAKAAAVEAQAKADVKAARKAAKAAKAA